MYQYSENFKYINFEHTRPFIMFKCIMGPISLFQYHSIGVIKKDDPLISLKFEGTVAFF
jgi:hypothetical protein